MWLNAGCLGQANSKDETADPTAAACDLRDAFCQCIGWVAEWCKCRPGNVVLTSGTTEACDLVLRSWPVIPSRLYYSDLTHVSVEQSVCQAARYLTHVTGTTVAVGRITISDLIGRPSLDFATAVTDRIAEDAGDRQGLLVLEHVTSEAGCQLPIVEVGQRLRSQLPRIGMVVDGAQAVGLWPVPPGFAGAYIGCFHKYANCPVETGFAVIPNVKAGCLPQHLGARTWDALELDGEYCPTCDVEKWQHCADVLSCETTITGIANRQLRIRELQSIFERIVGRRVVWPNIPSDSTYCSHILAIDCGSAQRAAEFHRLLIEHNYHTKLVGCRIRITLHHAIDTAQFTVFCEKVRSLLVTAS